METLRGGKRFSSVLFNMISKKNLISSEPPKFSVVASKKLSKSSVVRNRHKRRVYHAIREVVAGVEKEKFLGGVYIFFLKTAVKEGKFEKLKLEAGNILHRANSS